MLGKSIFLLALIALAPLPKKVKLSFNPDIGAVYRHRLQNDVTITLKALDRTSKVTGDAWIQSTVESKLPKSGTVVIQSLVDSMDVTTSGLFSNAPEQHWNSHDADSDQTLSAGFKPILYHEIGYHISALNSVEESTGINTLQKMIQEEQGFPGISMNPYENFPLLLVPYKKGKLKKGESITSAQQLLTGELSMLATKEAILTEIRNDDAFFGLRIFISSDPTTVSFSGTEFICALSGTLTGTAIIDIPTGLIKNCKLNRNLEVTLSTPGDDLPLTATVTGNLSLSLQ